MLGYWVLNSEMGSYLLDYKHNFIESTLPLYTCIFDPHRLTGPVAQWITRLTTDQKIPGSNPGRIETFQFSTGLARCVSNEWLWTRPVARYIISSTIINHFLNRRSGGIFYECRRAEFSLELH